MLYKGQLIDKLGVFDLIDAYKMFKSEPLLFVCGGNASPDLFLRSKAIARIRLLLFFNYNFKEEDLKELDYRSR